MKEVPRAPPDPESIEALEIGTHYLVADDLLARSASPLTISSSATLWALYSGKLIDGPDGRPNFLAWRNFTPDGAFFGELADPFQVAVAGEGNRAVLRTLAGE